MPQAKPEGYVTTILEEIERVATRGGNTYSIHGGRDAKHGITDVGAFVNGSVNTLAGAVTKQLTDLGFTITPHRGYSDPRESSPPYLVISW